MIIRSFAHTMLQVDQRQFDKIMGYIAAGKADGATVACGGERVGDSGLYVSPTIFTDVTDTMSIARGAHPILCACSYYFHLARLPPRYVLHCADVLLLHCGR